MFIKDENGQYFNTNNIATFDIDDEPESYRIRAWVNDEDGYFIVEEYPTEEQAKAELEKLVNTINEHDRPVVKYITVT